MEEKKTLEQQVVDTILQRKTTSLEIDGRTYEIPAPTPATIMLVSEETSKMPLINKETKSIFIETLRTARDCKAIGRIAAILVLGAKRIRENHQVVISETKKWSWRRFRFTKHQEAMRIMEDITPATLNETITKRLMEMQLGDFFGLTTSLSEINTLARTKEVEQTAPGQ